MNAFILLKDYLDKNAIPCAAVADAAGIKLSTAKSGLYNCNLGFEKFCKMAVVSGFDIDKNANSIADTFKMDKEECLNRLEVYEEAMKDRCVFKPIENIVAEAKEDTSFAVVCQMQKAAETAEKKAEAVAIPVPDALPALAEAVINHEGCAALPTAIAVEDDCRNNLPEKENEEIDVKDNVTNEPVHIGYNDVVRAVVCDMKGMQAVLVARVLDAIFHYKEDPDVNWIIDAQGDLSQLIEEHNM